MTPFQATLAVATPAVDQSAALVGVAVIALIVVAVVGAAIWGFRRLRSAQPVLRGTVSGMREEMFAFQMLREFLPDAQSDSGAESLLLESAPVPAAASNVGTGLADEVTGSVGVLDDFYANALTSKPVRSAGPATGTLTSGGSRPELSGEFGESVLVFVEGIRSLARTVEQAALLGGGSELDRAARSVEAFTIGLGALPIKDVLVSAGKAVKDVEAGHPGRDNPAER